MYFIGELIRAFVVSGSDDEASEVAEVTERSTGSPNGSPRWVDKIGTYIYVQIFTTHVIYCTMFLRNQMSARVV